MKKLQMLYVSNFNNKKKIQYVTPFSSPAFISRAGLDPPLLLYFPRLVIRTFLRLFRLRPPCAPGCQERIGDIFSKDSSIIWWCISNHWVNRKQNQDRMQQIGLGIGREAERQRMRRIGGWGSELKQWLSDVQKMVDLRRAKHDYPLA
jgi:hypothetical protein